MKSEKEKYLVQDLGVHFVKQDKDNKSEEQTKDYFLIGYENNEKNKFKDIVTGEVVEGGQTGSLISLGFPRNFFEGNNMALGYMTLFGKFDPSIRQCILAKVIDHKLKKPVIDIDNVAYIKDVMNSEIENSMAKKEAIEEREIAKQQELDKYMVSDSEKEF